MKTFFRAVAVVSFLSFLSLAAACGGSMDNDASGSDDLSAKSFDPVMQFAAVKKVASAYTSNIRAVSLNGERQSGASKSSSACTSFAWVWTVAGDNGIFVDVQINSKSVKVLRHEHRATFAGEAMFDPATVLVNVQDLLSIAAELDATQPTEISLSSTLAAEITGPRWDVTFPDGYMTIDGVTGKKE